MEEKNTCKRCKGDGHRTAKMHDNSGKQGHSCGIYGIVVCEFCLGKGYMTEEDRYRCTHNMFVLN